MARELPPTAGLPLHARDLLPGSGDLAQRAARWLGFARLDLECSGTASLVLLLHAMKRLKPDRNEIVVPAWTCPLVALAVHHAGLRVRLCDLAPQHYDMDANTLRDACSERTLAIIPTHLAGRVADVKTSISIAVQVGAFVIEDAAQALGAQVEGCSVGLAGDAAFFSLAVGKGLTLYEGGLMYIRDASLRSAVDEVRIALIRASVGWELRRSMELLAYAATYRPSLLSLVYGNPLRKALAAHDPVAAVGDDFGLNIPLHTVGRWRQNVGARALPRLPEFLRETRAQALPRIERLQRIDGITVLGDPPRAIGVWPFLLLILPSQRARDAALHALWGAGLGVTRLYVHALPDYDYLSAIVSAAEVPHARDIAARSLSITNSPWLDEATFERICAVLERIVGVH